MSGTPPDPTGLPVPRAADPVPTGRSRYEDFDLSEVPTPAPAPRRRTPTLAVASIVLAISGVLKLITVVAFRPSAATAFLVLGVAELVGATLVFALHPLGRPLGIALGCVGVAVGIVSATHSPESGMITLALNGFVVYALASSGPAFRRG